MNRVALTNSPLIKGLLRSRWPQLVLRAFTLGVFLLAILAGILGTPVGNRNIAIVLVWIAWWGLLALLAVPLFGRGWCSICPIPMPGEWLQQGSLLEPRGKGLGLGKRWPNPLRNIWIQNGAFLLAGVVQRGCPHRAKGFRLGAGGFLAGCHRRQPGLRAQGVLPLPVPGGRVYRPVLAIFAA